MGTAAALLAAVALIARRAAAASRRLTPAGAAPRPHALELARPRILGAGVDLDGDRSRGSTGSRTGRSSSGWRANANGWDSVTLDDDTIGGGAHQVEGGQGPRVPVRDRPHDRRRRARRRSATPARPAGSRRHRAHAAPEHVHAQPARGPRAARRQRPRHQHVRGAAAVLHRVRHAARRGLRVHPGGRARDPHAHHGPRAELYDNYVTPGSAGGAATVLPNNHRSKSAAALGVAALALLETSPPQGAPPADLRAPAAWLTFALDQVDLVQRWTFVAPDGGYGEGPYYQRYAGQNLLPFARAWSRANHAQPWDVGGRLIPDLWTSPWYRQTQRWMLDTTLPNGALAPIDDGNVDFSYYFGAAPTDPEDAAAFAWRWANAPTPYDTDGSIDLVGRLADRVRRLGRARSARRAHRRASTPRVATRCSAAAGTPTRRPRSSSASTARRWSSAATATATARSRPPRTSRPTPAASRSHAFGERLLLDPGYLTLPGTRPGREGHRPQHDPRRRQGSARPVPRVDPVGRRPRRASRRWTVRRRSPAPATRRSSTPPGSPAATRHQGRPPLLLRRRPLPHRRRHAAGSAAVRRPTFTWPLHGNGGGTSGGTFTRDRRPAGSGRTAAPDSTPRSRPTPGR